MNLTECLVCGVTLWQTADSLCWQHHQWRMKWRLSVQMLRLQRAVWENELSDFYYRDWNYREIQFSETDRKTSWRVIVADINRLARYWLDDDSSSDEGRVA